MLKWYLKDAPIARKIQIGYGLLVGGVALGAGYTALHVGELDSAVSEYRATARTNAASAHAIASALQMRVAARDSYIGAREGDAEAVANARTELDQHLNAAVSELQKAREFAPVDAWKAQFAAIEGMLAEYHSLAVAADTPEEVARRHAVAIEMMEVFDALEVGIQDRQDELGPVMTAKLEATTQLSMLLAILVILVGAGLAMLLSSVIAKPLSRMTDSMERLARGDLTTEVIGAERGDDAGRLARALETFKQSALEVERLKQEQIAAEARAAEEKRKAMNDLASSFEASVFQVVDAVAAASTELEASAESLSRTAREAAISSLAEATV